MSVRVSRARAVVAQGRRPAVVARVRRVTAGWTELGLTWSNQPTVAATPTDTINQPATLSCVVYTVTADVQAWVDGTTNNGWRLRDTIENDVKTRIEYRSRENSATAERPELDVTYS